MWLLLPVLFVLKKVKKLIYLIDTERWRKCETLLMEVQQKWIELIFLCLSLLWLFYAEC